MKISSIGKYKLIASNGATYDLNDGTNLVYVKNNCVSVGKALDNASASFVVNFISDKIMLIKISGQILVDSRRVIKEIELNDTTSIIIADTELTLKFFPKESSIEILVDAFIDGNLELPIDIDNLFYEYASKLRITDKKAISNVMAAIDIPEIDKL